MRWDRLFDDLESQPDHEQREEERALALETERLRIGRLGLRERLTAMVAAGGWVVGLFIFLRAVALPKVTEVLDARRREIEGDLEKAAALKANAEKTLAQYQAAIAKGREEAQALLRKVGDEAQARATAAQDALGRKLAQQIKGAEERIESARKQALANVERVSAELAQAATERLIGVKLDAAVAAGAVGAVAKERGA